MAGSNFEYVWKFLLENGCVGAENITTEMHCTICENVMINAHIAHCGCRFCQRCATQHWHGNCKFYPDNTMNFDEDMNKKISTLIVKCPRVGCEHRSALIDMEKHERVCERDVEMGDIATLSQDRREQQRIMEQQAERIAHFDEEMRPVKAENQSMREQIISLQSEIHAKLLHHEWKLDYLQKQAVNDKEELLRKVNELTMKLRGNLINVANYESGEFVWVIDQLPARCQKAPPDGTIVDRIYSNAFCMHEHGYRMCLSLWPMDGSDLDIQWHLMQGPFDKNLPWPFAADVTVSVIDQETRLDHDSKTVRYNECSNDVRWEKPTRLRSDGFKIGNLINLNELSRNPALFKDGRLLIKCVVTMI